MSEKKPVSFVGKVAVVTGAGAGLGRAYSLELAKRGAKVVVNDLGGARDGSGTGSQSAADRVVAEIEGGGGIATPNYDNVATPEGGANIVQSALDAYGRLDILVNNAGILRDKSFMKMEMPDWDAVINVHLRGAFCVSSPAFKVMKENGYGRIVMITSAAGLYGNFGQTNYGAAKMGIVGLMNSLKVEGAKYGIKVNTVAPLAASRMTEDIMPPEILAKMGPEFVAPLVVYLCSEDCPVSGMIYNAGMGYYGRAALLSAPGVILGGDNATPSLEDIATHWEGINGMEGAQEHEQLNNFIAYLFQAFQDKK